MENRVASEIRSEGWNNSIVGRGLALLVVNLSLIFCTAGSDPRVSIYLTGNPLPNLKIKEARSYCRYLLEFYISSSVLTGNIKNEGGEKGVCF